MALTMLMVFTCLKWQPSKTKTRLDEIEASGIDLLEMTTTENAVFYWYAPDIGIDLLEMTTIEN